MALGGGKWTTQNKVLPGSYINFEAANTSGGGISTNGSFVLGPLVFEIDVEGNLHVTYNSDLATFELQENGDLYAEYDEAIVVFALDDSGNLYYEEVA